jgi:uncharacterized protein YlxP (DUF503 family)
LLTAVFERVPGVLLYHMNIGVCTVNLRIPENMSLKGKRQVLKSIISRVRNKFNVAVAEVDDNDVWQLATIGICCISNNNRHTNEVLSKVVDFIIGARFDVEILDYGIEIIGV